MRSDAAEENRTEIAEWLIAERRKRGAEIGIGFYLTIRDVQGWVGRSVQSMARTLAY